MNERTGTTALFTPFTLKDITLRNRIAVAPMCQYSAVDGLINDWHVAHYTAIARGGPGLVLVEATAVAPEGRITPGCLGIWHDGQAAGLARVAAAIKAGGAVAGIQLAHAGRKASANRPWEGDDHMAPDDPRGWGTIAPSAIAFGNNLPKLPRAMSKQDIARVTQNFVDGAIRALDAGFEWLELHFAHGYLAQSFFSVHANERNDDYGGSFAGRSRFILETLAAVREVWPKNLPLTVRFGVIEYDGRDEQTLNEAIALARAMREGGLDMLNVSIGFSTPEVNIPWAPGLLAPIAGRVRAETGLPVASSWGLDDPELANRVVAEGQMDLVMLGRAFLSNPHYAYHLALALKQELPAWVLPAPYAHWLERYKR